MLYFYCFGLFRNQVATLANFGFCCKTQWQIYSDLVVIEVISFCFMVCDIDLTFGFAHLYLGRTTPVKFPYFQWTDLVGTS